MHTHQDAPGRTRTHQGAPGRTRTHQDAPGGRAVGRRPQITLFALFAISGQKWVAGPWPGATEMGYLFLLQTARALKTSRPMEAAVQIKAPKLFRF